MRLTSFARGAGAALLALSALGSALAAQQRMPPPGGNRNPQRIELERRLRERYANMVKERLGLSEEQSQQLEQAVESFTEPRERLMSDEQALRRRIEAILIEQDPSDDEARSLLTRMQELRVEETRVFQAEQDALLQFLTPVQVVRFHALRERLGQRIQQLRGGPTGPGRPPGGDGIGPVGDEPDGLPPRDPWGMADMGGAWRSAGGGRGLGGPVGR